MDDMINDSTGANMDDMINDSTGANVDGGGSESGGRVIICCGADTVEARSFLLSDDSSDSSNVILFFLFVPLDSISTNEYFAVFVVVEIQRRSAFLSSSIERIFLFSLSRLSYMSVPRLVLTTSVDSVPNDITRVSLIPWQWSRTNIPVDTSEIPVQYNWDCFCIHNPDSVSVHNPD